MKAKIAAILATSFVAGTVLAAEAPEFAMIDKNHDGYVSKEEASASPEIMELFTSVDADKDGKLSSTEYAEAIKKLS
jgi:EF-hand domain pair